MQYIWILGSHRSRNEIWTKNSLSGYGDFFPNLDKKNHRFDIWQGFGGDLEHPNIWIFEQIDELRQSPSISLLFYILSDAKMDLNTKMK
jgi:hypothetical protein